MTVTKNLPSHAPSGLEVSSLTLTAGGTTLVRGASCRLQACELVALLGPNGAGKTSLLRGAIGLAPAEAGWARIDGENAAGMSPRRRARTAHRRHRIHPAGMERMTTAQAGESEPRPAEASVTPDCFLGVVRAGRLEATRPGEQKAQRHPIAVQQRRRQRDQPSIDQAPSRAKQLHATLIAAPARGAGGAGSGGSRSAAS